MHLKISPTLYDISLQCIGCQKTYYVQCVFHIILQSFSNDRITYNVNIVNFIFSFKLRYHRIENVISKNVHYDHVNLCYKIFFTS